MQQSLCNVLGGFQAVAKQTRRTSKYVREQRVQRCSTSLYSFTVFDVQVASTSKTCKQTAFAADLLVGFLHECAFCGQNVCLQKKQRWRISSFSLWLPWRVAECLTWAAVLWVLSQVGVASGEDCNRWSVTGTSWICLYTFLTTTPSKSVLSLT